jgi:hypothetical protein
MTGDFGRRKGRAVRAVLGVIVLFVAIIAIVLSQLGGSGSHPEPMSTRTGQPGAPPPPDPTGTADVVDRGVGAQGWVPEPITRNPDVYVRAALEAAGTVDTTRTTRSEWVSWLQSWFTPNPLYENKQDGLDQMAAYKAELDQAVAQPQQMWDELASEKGRVSAHVQGKVDYLKLAETSQRRMWTGTADVVMTYTRTENGSEVRYDETVRVSVQVVCGGQSIPTPDSAQRAGDCKVVRFFDTAVG